MFWRLKTNNPQLNLSEVEFKTHITYETQATVERRTATSGSVPVWVDGGWRVEGGDGAGRFKKSEAWIQRKS